MTGEGQKPKMDRTKFFPEPEEEPVRYGAQQSLSPFQKEKLSFYFKIFGRQTLFSVLTQLRS